jgi:hypothetical protein
LEAVNEVLEAIGHAPIASLTNIPNADSQSALNRLRQISGEVQAEGWFFNTNFDYQLPVDSNGTVPLPEAALTVDTVGRSYNDYDVTDRDGKLYDLQRNTFQFPLTAVIKVDMVLELPWTHLQEMARRYIVAKTARRYAESKLGDPNRSQFTRSDEGMARSHLKSVDNRQADRRVVRSARRIYELHSRSTGNRTVSARS